MHSLLPLALPSVLSQDTGLPLPLYRVVALLLLSPAYVSLGVSVLASAPLLAFASRSSRLAKLIVYHVAIRTLIPALRSFLDTVPTWLVYTWWLRSANIAQDGRRVLQDVAIGEHLKFGSHTREWLQALHPCGPQTQLEPQMHVLFVHGGGWIAANATLLAPSMTPLARNLNCVVWMMNYPLSPAAQFPTPVLSVLKALRFLKSKSVDRVVLVGDSAGGNLATSAAAFVASPALLDRVLAWQRVRDPALEQMPLDSFPVVLGVSSLYGVLDRHAWQADVPGISWLENKLSQFAIGFVFMAFSGDEFFADDASPKTHQCLEGALTLVDLLPMVDAYPQTLLMCGSRDVLVHSSRVAHAALCSRGFASEFLEFDARHAFVGLPPALNVQRSWVRHSQPATQRLMAFVRECHNQQQH
jgi:acetyl esterase/lipase